MIRKKQNKSTKIISPKLAEKINFKSSHVEISRTVAYFFIALLATTAFFSGYFYSQVKGNSSAVVNGGDQARAPTAGGEVSIDTIKGLFSKNVVKFGKGDKKLLMVEVSDPSCPFCHVAAGVNKEIGAEMGDRFKLKSQGGTYVAPVEEMRKLVEAGKADYVYLYMNGHGNGELATKALYCAFDQGKFWQAHDVIMTAKGYEFLNNEIKADASKTKEMADFLGSAVNNGDLKSCLDSGKYDARLAEEEQLARSLGVDGTPGFYLNTANFSGAYSWEEMKSAAEEGLR